MRLGLASSVPSLLSVFTWRPARRRVRRGLAGPGRRGGDGRVYGAVRGPRPHGARASRCGRASRRRAGPVAPAALCSTAHSFPGAADNSDSASAGTGRAALLRASRLRLCFLVPGHRFVVFSAAGFALAAACRRRLCPPTPTLLPPVPIATVIPDLAKGPASLADVATLVLHRQRPVVPLQPDVV